MVSSYQIEAAARKVHQELANLEKAVILASENEYSAEEAANAIASLHGMKSYANAIYKQYEEQALKSIDVPVRLESGALVEKKVGKPRKKWQHREIATELANRIVLESYDLDTGEVMRSKEEMIVELLKYAGVGYWKVGQLKKVGISADKYCDVGEPNESIVVTTSKEEL